MIIRFQGKSRTWCVFQIDWWFFSFQVTIVIKYFFQFGFFPFHSSVDKNKPLHPPNIIGVEKKDGYVHYDLVQLLALFFHRSILKVWANTKIYRRLPHMKTKTIKNYRRILFLELILLKYTHYMCLFIHDITDLIFHHELIFIERENIFQISADKIKFLCTFYGLIYASERPILISTSFWQHRLADTQNWMKSQYLSNLDVPAGLFCTVFLYYQQMKQNQFKTAYLQSCKHEVRFPSGYIMTLGSS